MCKRKKGKKLTSGKQQAVDKRQASSYSRIIKENKK